MTLTTAQRTRLRELAQQHHVLEVRNATMLALLDALDAADAELAQLRRIARCADRVSDSIVEFDAPDREWLQALDEMLDVWRTAPIQEAADGAG